MAKSQLIKDLAIGKIELDAALRRLLIIVIDLDNKKLNEWIKYELDGYPKSSFLPEYRKKIGGILKYSGFNGRIQVTNAPLPLQFLSEQYRDLAFGIDCKEGIALVKNYSKENASIDYTYLAPDVFQNSNNLISCVSITLKLNSSSYESILSIITTKLIEILMELEKEFGVLDNLDIDVENSSNIEKVNNNINSYMMYDDRLGEF